MFVVIGGTGFIGSAIVKELHGRGKPVAVVSRDAAKVDKVFPGLGIEVRTADAREPAQVLEAVRGAEGVVISLAFDNFPMEKKSAGRTFEDVDQKGAETVAGVAREAGVGYLVYLSGAGAGPEARYHWFRAKWAAEEAVRNSGVAFTIIRPSWVYGPGDKSLNRMLGFGRFLPFIPVIGDGSKQKLQPVFVDDVARAVAESFERPEAQNKTLEIGGPEVHSMDEVVRTALEVSGRKRPILHQPKGLMKAVASVASILPGPPLTPDGVEFASMDAVVDNTDLQTALGIQPRSLREGLATYMA